MSGPQKFRREGRDSYQRCGPDGAAALSATTLRSDHPRTAHRWAWWWPTSAHRLTESLPLATTSWWQPAHPMRRGHVPGERLSAKTRWKHVSLLKVADACHAPAAPESWPFSTSALHHNSWRVSPALGTHNFHTLHIIPLLRRPG